MSNSKVIEDAIKQLTGQDPTAEDIKKFYKIKEICGFSDHDAIWSMLLAFGHYEILYKEIPDKIKEAQKSLIAEHKNSLRDGLESAENAVRANLAKAVSDATSEIRTQGEKIAFDIVEKATVSQIEKFVIFKTKKAILILSGTLALIITTVLGSAAWLGYETGLSTNKELSTWATSKEGKLAKKFSELNDIEALLDCPSPYSTENKPNGIFCVPASKQKDGSYLVGKWRIK